MKKTQILSELKEKDIKRIKNRPAISAFKDNLSMDSVLKSAYILPRYKLRKHGKSCIGIEAIYKDFSSSNIIFVGQGGTGKTTTFLRLYTCIGIDNASAISKPFYYIFAPDLHSSRNKLTDYQKKLRAIIEQREKLDGILLLDGLEEAFQSDIKGAASLIESLNNSDITFWVSCRTSFYERLEDCILPVFDECVEVNLWEPTEFDTFVEQSLRENDERIVVIQRINRVRKNLESLLNRPLFATMILFVAENNEIDDAHNEYELIELFLDKWRDREHEEKKYDFDIEASFECMRKVALDVYCGKRPRYDKQLRPFRDLLWMPNRKGSIHQFCHREFLIYFIVNAMIDAALHHQEKIVWWFSQTFYDDITNMIKPVLARLSAKDSGTIFENLFSVYKSTYEEKSKIETQFNTLGLAPGKSFLKLRDEIIYFVLKLQNVDHEMFVEYASHHDPDTMLSLGIAYGMAGIDPNNRYTFEFAKKLIPGTPEDIRNRGWGMCFFGDVAKDGYEYDDSERKPWNKIRENRLRRLLDGEKKCSTRVLDIPLLYCFYHSRDFNDCISFKDYCIIRDTNISLPVFQSKQQALMRERKNQLVEKYRNHMLNMWLSTNTHYHAEILKENLSMNSGTEIITLQINSELANRIIGEIEHKETVRENIRDFWNENGSQIIDKYEKMLDIPEYNNLSRVKFNKMLTKSKVLLLSANSVEGRVVSRRLMNENGGKKLDAFVADGHLYQFSKIGSIPVLHIWPTDMSSYTMYGSFSAVDSALDRFTPNYVISVGVAFGIDPQTQSFGDVIVAKNLVFYDNYNKVTDGKTKLRREDTYTIEANLMAQLHVLENEKPPTSVGDFKWYFGSILTGGTVLSDAEEKKNLVNAAQNIGQTIIGGEMEASGIYYACQRIKNRSVPFLIFKGICDWGAEKNGWDAANIEGLDREKVKDCIQAFACNNAYDAMRYNLLHLNMEIDKE